MTTTELPQGTILAGHRIDGVAGRGGMGVVYRATDLALERPVALKVIGATVAGDPVFRARFQRECREAAALEHPNVVPVYHAGEDEGRLYLTMRFVDGTDLGALIARSGHLQPAEAAAILRQIASALDEAHRHGLVHRDVKPPNVLIDAQGHAYLTDFGVVKRPSEDPALTATGFVMGTADYVAPETIRGTELDARADVYALACVLFQAITGRTPYDGATDVEKLLAHVRDPVPSPRDVRPGLPAALDDVFRRGLAKRPAERHATAGALIDEFEAALAGRPASTAAPAPPRRLRVAVADDSLLVRAGIVRVLQECGFDVVAEAGDSDGLLEAVREHRPDVAVTDLRMPPDLDDEGLRAALRIRREFPSTAVLLLSSYADETIAADLLSEGAHGVGYLLKDRVTDPDAFAHAVRQIGAGGFVLDPEVAGAVSGGRRAPSG